MSRQFESTLLTPSKINVSKYIQMENTPCKNNKTAKNKVNIVEGKGKTKITF